MHMSGKHVLVQGIGASFGVAEGRVRVVHDSKDADDFRPGDILVTRLTDPTFVLLMAQAGAIVCDIGGMTSHPAIVSRELGIPCVVNAQNATEVLKDGMRVRVDGKQGTIFLLDNSNCT